MATPKPGQGTVNASLLRLLVRARAQLTRLELRAFRRDVIPVLVALRGEILASIESAAKKKKGLGSVTKKQFGVILKQVDQAVANAGGDLKENLDKRLSAVARRESRILKAAVAKSSPEIGSIFTGLSVAEIANVAKKGQSAIRKPISAAWSKKTTAAVKQSIALSISKGEDLAAAGRRLSKVADFSKRQAAQIARTSIQRNAVEVTNATVAKNEDLFIGSKFIATLDLDTCPTCGDLDGNLYTFKKHGKAAGRYADRPDIPVHPYCRCIYAPVTKTWRELGFDRDELSPGTRASMDGQVPETLDYDEWVKDAAAQTRPSWIRSFLSPERFAAFERGERLEDFAHEVAAWSAENMSLPPLSFRRRSRVLETESPRVSRRRAGSLRRSASFRDN